MVERYTNHLSIHCPPELHQSSRKNARKLDLRLSRYAVRSLRLVRAIGQRVNPRETNLILPGGEQKPLPRLLDPGNDPHIMTLYLPMTEYEALNQDCERIGISKTSRIRRCLNFTNYLVEHDAFPPQLAAGEEVIDYIFL